MFKFGNYLLYNDEDVWDNDPVDDPADDPAVDNALVDDVPVGNPTRNDTFSLEDDLDIR